MSERTGSVRLFKNSSILEEKPNDFDSLEYKHEIENVRDRIERLVGKGRHSIVAYLGPYGAGKSTVLKTLAKTSDYTWITFEMWRYANRNELWDGFVIKTSAELSRHKDESIIADAVEGKTLSRREIISLIVWILCIFAGLSIISLTMWLSVKNNTTIATPFIVAYLKYAFPIIMTVLLLVGLGRFFQLGFITDKRPSKRVFELEYILMHKIKNIKKPLVIVVEDADRSAPDGMIFLETLNYFLLNKAPTTQPVIIIAPQSSRAFNRIENSNEGLETALKIYDEKIYFKSSLTDVGIENFYNTLEIDPLFKKSLEEATRIITKDHRRSITIRLLKHALRETEQFYEMNSGVNPAIALVIILSRYVSIYSGGSVVSAKPGSMESAGWLLTREYGSEDTKTFFLAIAQTFDKQEEVRMAQHFTLEFTDTVKPKIATKIGHNNHKSLTIGISNSYSALIN